MDQTLSFVRSRDGVRIACARSGEGSPVVRVATWLTHLEFDWESTVWGHWFRFLSDRHTLIRYDERGCGLSDRNLRSLSFDGWVADLEAVVDAMGLERFPLLGMSQGAAVAIEYAARHPERVSQLVLFGGFAAGWQYAPADIRDRWQAIRELVRVGWGDENPAFRSLFGYLFVPEADPDSIRWYAELAQRSSDRHVATAIVDVFGSLDVTKRMKQVTAPTLVVHAEHDSVVPMDAGRGMAEGIPAARFAGLDSRNHLLLEGEPAWDRFRALFTEFVTEAPRPRPPPRVDFSSLTTRERQILACLAEGLSNGQIARTLFISEKTVRNHVSSILDKLGVESRARALVLARDANFRA